MMRRRESATGRSPLRAVHSILGGSEIRKLPRSLRTDRSSICELAKEGLPAGGGVPCLDESGT